MLRRYIMKMLFSLLFLLLFSIKFVDMTFSFSIGNHPLLTGWEGTGIPLKEVEIEGWTKLNDEYTMVSSLEKTAASLERRLRLKNLSPPLTGDELDFSYVNVEGELPDHSRVYITLQSIRGESNTAETFCGVIILLNPEADLSDNLVRLKRVLEPVVGEIPLSITLGGKWKGRISEGEAYNLMKTVFSRLQVSEVIAETGEDYGKWAALTNLLEETVTKEGTKLNLEFAYRYQEEEDITHINLATPFLPGYIW